MACVPNKPCIFFLRNHIRLAHLSTDCCLQNLHQPIRSEVNAHDIVDWGRTKNVRLRTKTSMEGKFIGCSINWLTPGRWPTVKSFNWTNQNCGEPVKAVTQTRNHSSIRRSHWQGFSSSSNSCPKISGFKPWHRGASSRNWITSARFFDGHCNICNHFIFNCVWQRVEGCFRKKFLRSALVRPMMPAEPSGKSSVNNVSKPGTTLMTFESRPRARFPPVVIC